MKRLRISMEKKNVSVIQVEAWLKEQNIADYKIGRMAMGVSVIVEDVQDMNKMKQLKESFFSVDDEDAEFTISGDLINAPRIAKRVNGKKKEFFGTYYNGEAEALIAVGTIDELINNGTSYEEMINSLKEIINSNKL